MVCEPFRAQFPTTVIWSPGLNKDLDQPRRDIVTMLAASADHLSTLPSAFFTSKKISECGFINWKSVTVPFKVVNFLESYADAPWCAKTGTEAMRNPAARAKKRKALVFMGHLLSWREYPTATCSVSMPISRRTGMPVRLKCEE